MLSQLYIENIAVISQATIDFSPGFNVFTGETGAGKTILMNAINAVLGARTSREIIRTGQTRAFISALFTDLSASVRRALADIGYPTGEELLITRTLELSGSTSCKVNGKPATVSMLHEIAQQLIDVHGQRDSAELLYPERHMAFLDEFGNHQKLLDDYTVCYTRLCALREQLKALQLNESQRLQRMDVLSYQITEIEEAALTAGEEEELTAQKQLIRNAERITTSLSTIYTLLNGNDEADGVLDGLSEISQEIELIGQYLPEIKEYSEKSNELLFLMQELSHSVRNQLDEMEFDPRQLDLIEDRLALISRLKRKYGGTIAEILSYLEQCHTDQDNLICSDKQIARIQKELDSASLQTSRAAALLTKARKATAKQLTALVAAELSYLDMPHVKLSVRHNDKEFSPDGCDVMEFMISTNAGEEEKPLSRIASGGELSRVMLAIKTVLADKGGVATMIFDEIDTGVSGRAARKIGAKLAQTAQNKQVICVTHLAPVAAFGNRHIKIYKDVLDGRTYTHVQTLDRQQRIEELARISVGEQITESSRRSAEELLSLSGN